MQPCETRPNIIIQHLNQICFKHLLHKVLSFLSFHDLETIHSIMEKTLAICPLKDLILVDYYFRSYFNKVDRSLYYSFYDDKMLKNNEENHIMNLNHSQTSQFLNLAEFNVKVQKFMGQLVPSFIEREQILSEINRMFSDPDLPLPKLKRESQGIFCKSVFQNFLVSLTTNHSNDFDLFIEGFEALKEYFITQQSSYLKNFFFKAKKNQILNLKIHVLRFTPYDINYLNYQEFLCEKFSLHNILVCIFALIDIWLSSAKLYLQSLNDLFHRHIEFLTKYGIFRNIILSVEENLGFMFEQYHELYSEIYMGNKPVYHFWRPAMTKWLMKMQVFHEQCDNVYHYCFTKLRMNHLVEGITEKEKQDPEIFMYIFLNIGFRSVKNALQRRQYEMEANKLIKRNELSNQIEGFFERNNQLYEIAAIQYIQYMIDFSVNEETVHWCGHSKQFLSEPYISFERKIIERNKQFISQFAKKQNRYLRQTIIGVFSIEVEIFKKLEIKPTTLYKMVDSYNSILEYLPSKILTEENEEEEMQFIRYDFASNDDILYYYNDKQGRKFALEKDQQKLYNINSILSTDQLIKKSISTAYDEECEDHEDGDLSELIGIIRNKSADFESNMDIQER